jgi:hypothetical protein
MPKLTEDELVNPSASPINYPGPVLTSDSLLIGNWRYSMQPHQGLRLGSYLVTCDGGPLAATAIATLTDILASLSATPIEDRYPVVAVGSNASPGQLAHKFHDNWESSIIPATIVIAYGIGAGYSAHINRAGYMPFTPVHDNINSYRLMALWLNAEQLERLTSTEPNYYPSTLDETECPLMLSSREPLSRFIVYRTRWGVFRLTPDSPPLLAGSQEAAYQNLANLDWFRALVPESGTGPLNAMARLATQQELRDTVREAFSSEGNRTEDGFSPVEFDPVTYGGGAGAKAWGVPGAWG